MRLIDADVLLADVGDYHWSNEYLVRLINQQKTIIEKKKGEWLPHPYDNDWDVCSVCGTGCCRRVVTKGSFTIYSYKFCPHCGADMGTGRRENEW